MMQNWVVFVLCALLAVVTASKATEEHSGGLHCKHEIPDIPKGWIDMTRPCVKAVRNHVQEEINAAVQYLAMAAYFSRDTVNKLGFANMFFKSADEERQHATQFIGYLLWRGELEKDVGSLINRSTIPKKLVWESGLAALKDALILEANVTKKIKAVIKECEDPSDKSENDYHIVDYLTAEFLQEQNEGEHELARKISKMNKLVTQHGPLSEWIFNKELLE